MITYIVLDRATLTEPRVLLRVWCLLDRATVSKPRVC